MGPLIAAAADAAAKTSGPSVPVWLQILALLVGPAVVSAIVSGVNTASQATSEARRQGYADAIEAILAWAEYPYRIRRRTSDDVATLGKLADLGHELQERRARTLGWVAGENAELYKVFKSNVSRLDATVGPLIAEAWHLPPITTAGAMVLAGWGAGRLAAETLERLNEAVSLRNGWRRWLSVTPWLLRQQLERLLPSSVTLSAHLVPFQPLGSHGPLSQPPTTTQP